MSRKSQFKEVIRTAFPSVFVSEDDPQARDNVTFTISDAMIDLQSFYPTGDRLVTGNDVIKYMLRGTMDYLNNTACKLYVFMFDKPGYVFKVKGIEHQKRALKRKIAPAPDPEEGQDLLPLDSSIPYNWTSMMANRKIRKALMQQIANAMIKYFHPPAGKMLVIDGGLLDIDYQPVTIYSHLPKPGQKAVNERKSVLLCDTAVLNPEKDLTQRDIQRPEQLANRVGEADICYLFYLNYFRETQEEYRRKNGIPAEKDPIYVDVKTHDTDFIPISLSYFNNIAKSNFYVRVVFNKGKKEDSDKRCVLLVHKLYEELANLLGPFIKRPDLSTIAAMMSSGNDYVDGYGGLVPERTLKVFLLEAEYIGDLVDESEEGWKINAQAYGRFLKAMYCDKYQKAIWKEAPGKRKADDMERLWSDFWKNEISWPILRKIVENHNKKKITGRVPSNGVMWLRMLRLQFNLEILRIGYKIKPEDIDLKCLEYGFSLVETAKPLGFHNIRITGDTDAECQPERKFLRSMGEVVESPIRKEEPVIVQPIIVQTIPFIENPIPAVEKPVQVESNMVVHCMKSKFDVYIGRRNPRFPGFDPKWGNPFVIGVDGDRNTVIKKYEEFLKSNPKMIEDAKRELKGKILGCWCGNALPCHGDVLARIANEP